MCCTLCVLAGYWLGAGSMVYRHLVQSGPQAGQVTGVDGVCFTLKNNEWNAAHTSYSERSDDKTWLLSMFDSLGLVVGQDVLMRGASVDAPGTTEFIVVRASWFAYFDEEYGRNYHNADFVGSLQATRPPTVPADASAQDAAAPASSMTVNSGKRFFGWVLRLCNKAQLRLIIEGMRRASGSWLHDSKVIVTSSTVTRDELIIACLHAGYSAYFIRKCATGWLTMIDGVHTERTGEDWWVVYAEPDGGGSGGRASTPVLRRQMDVHKRTNYVGRIWCVHVPTGLIVAQRAVRQKDGIVTQVSRPIIVGNSLPAEYSLFVEAFKKTPGISWIMKPVSDDKHAELAWA